MKKLFISFFLLFSFSSFAQTLHIFDNQSNQKKYVLEIKDNVVGFISNDKFTYIDCKGIQQENISQSRFSFLSTTKSNGLLQINKETHYQKQCGEKIDFFINIHTQFVSFRETNAIDFDENYYLLIEN